MTLSCLQVREHVRLYLDVDEEDFPSTLIDRWTFEGWGKITRTSRIFPLYQTTVELTTTAGIQGYDTELREILSIYEQGEDGFLPRLDQTQARGMFDPPIEDSRPTHWSTFENQIRFWPAPDAAYTYTIEGYRHAEDPRDKTDPSSAIDLPRAVFEEALLSWVMHKACMKEGEFEQAEMFRRDFEEYTRQIVREENHTRATIVLNSRGAEVDTTYPPDMQPMRFIG